MKCRAPTRFIEDQAPPEFPSSVEDYFRQLYFNAIDIVIGGLKDRFEHLGFSTYSQPKHLLIKASQGKFMNCTSA